MLQKAKGDPNINIIFIFSPTLRHSQAKKAINLLPKGSKNMFKFFMVKEVFVEEDGSRCGENWLSKGNRVCWLAAWPLIEPSCKKSHKFSMDYKTTRFLIAY
jgi:hypothetical protein